MTTSFCLALAVVLVAFSLLAVFRAPTFFLFFAAVGATEFGHLFGAVAVLLATSVPKDSVVGIAAAGLATIAAVLLFSPLARAWLGLAKIRDAFRRGLGIDLPSLAVQLAMGWVPGVSHRSSGQRIKCEGVPEMDFFRAPTSRSAPLVVLIHGGGWMAGDVHELAGWNRWLAAKGWAVAAVEYRLVPGAAWPAQREDVMAAVEHLRAHAAEFGVDPDRIVFLGRSAGGQIASAIAATGGHDWLRGCVCLYSPFDMDFAYAHSREDDLLRPRWLLRCYLGGSPDERAGVYRDASAYLTVEKSAPPFLLLHGGRDELVWSVQSERFAERLNERGVPNAFIRLPWATHAFDYNMRGPAGLITAACLDAFLRRVGGSKGA